MGVGGLALARGEGQGDGGGGAFFEAGLAAGLGVDLPVLIQAGAQEAEATLGAGRAFLYESR